MFFGTTVAPEISFELLDRYVGAGGRLVDTANNYAFWVEGATGDESELLLGRWLASRGSRDDVLIATKIGARPRPGGTSTAEGLGLSADAVAEQVKGSLGRLGIDRIDLLYAHIDDAVTPLDETLAAFDALVTDGLVGAIAASNLTLPRLRAAHAISDAGGLSRYAAIQQRATFLTAAPEAEFGVQVPLDDETSAYAREQGLTVFGYAALLAGAYGGQRPVPVQYRHAGTERQLAVVHEVAQRYGVTAPQVALAWLAAQQVVPVLGVSSLDQLEQALAAADLELDAAALTDLAAVRGR